MADARTADVVVIGGGVMGCATAYFLARAGVRVTLVEQHRIGGAPSASGASAAILDPLAGNPPPLAQQGQLSRRLLLELAPELRERSGIDVELQQLGTIHLAYGERDVEALRTRVPALFAELGEPTEWLDAGALRALEPAVAERVRGGLLIPSSHGIYAPKYVRALAAAAATHGATVLQGVAVTGCQVAGERVMAVQTSQGSLAAEQVLLATGAWSGMAGRWLRATLPIGPQRGQIAALTSQPGQARVAHVLHGPGGYIIPKANGTACVGATHEMVGFDARITTGGMKFLADLALRLAPGLESATLRHVWLGFRPVRLDGGMPAVGRLPGLENAYVAAGHGAIGMTVSAAVGHLMAQLIQGQAPDLPLDEFAP